MGLPKYYKSYDEKNFVERVIQDDIRCLANDVQELYAAQNDCWFEDVENFFNEETDEPHEVFQWFIVSDWLAKHLTDQGNPILTMTSGKKLWGRTSFGQALELDGTFQTIFRGL